MDILAKYLKRIGTAAKFVSFFDYMSQISSLIWVIMTFFSIMKTSQVVKLLFNK